MKRILIVFLSITLLLGAANCFMQEEMPHASEKNELFNGEFNQLWSSFWKTVILNFGPETSTGPEKLRLLLLSDIHMNLANVEKLKRWVSAESAKYDYIIISGDFVNLSEEDQYSGDPQKEAEAVEYITSILESLESINENIIYIPGNHDPASLHALKKNELPKLTKFSQNLNNDWKELAPGLAVFGLGGSVPAYEKQIDGSFEEVWWPFPWLQEKDYSNTLNRLFNETVNHYKKKSTTGSANVQLIMLTHTGPFQSSTAIEFDDTSDTYTGSSGQEKLFRANVRDFLCMIHGHTHISAGRVDFSRVPVINPGSILEGLFGEMHLVKDESGKWSIKEILNIDLNTYNV